MWSICGKTLSPGEKLQTVLSVDMGGLSHGGTVGPVLQSLDRNDLPGGYEMPATLICGRKPGKTLLITASIHSGEYPGVPAVIHTAKDLDPEKMCGNVLMVHCVNTSGFWARSDALVPEDKFNLNRKYPGRPDGTVGERIADFFATQVMPNVDFVLDLHSGGGCERMTPCLFFPRAEQVTEASLAAAKALNVPYLLASSATDGEYSYAANTLHKPALLIERGGCTLSMHEWSEDYHRDIRLLMDHLGIYPAQPGTRDECMKRVVYRNTIYLTSTAQGIWYAKVMEDTDVKKGDLLGVIEDFYGNCIAEYYAQEDGHVFYYTAGLSVREGSDLIAYGVKDSVEPV